MPAIHIIGVDCATQHKKVGLALGELTGQSVRLLTVDAGNPAEIISAWCERATPRLIALDAPLGWPIALAEGLKSHSAGQPLEVSPDELFNRATDRAIEERLGKKPLEVGANLIARTAVSALVLLQATESTVV